jgi:hypothetical protein
MNHKRICQVYRKDCWCAPKQRRKPVSRAHVPRSSAAAFRETAADSFCDSRKDKKTEPAGGNRNGLVEDQDLGATCTSVW